ncbi:hypothetical protein [Proteus terrae]|uniref:hypothetical protein n=1 Tax=Proteus terrae TaxID=1574161 RepID=UPI000D687FA6|nr:hypothetical protein [Proteus terrae]
MEFKGTPAPWVIDERAMSAINSSTKHVALVNYSHHGRDKDVFGDEHKANTYLIAAAPELLDALIEMQRNGRKQGWDDKYESSMEKTRLAIAKALGQQ